MIIPMFLAVSILISAFLLIVSLIFLFSSKNSSDCFAVGIVALIFGFLGLIPSMVISQKNITITYETPTSIIKTNNFVVVFYIAKGNTVMTRQFNEIEYWNSTNILVEKTSGYNIWGVEVGPDNNIVLDGQLGDKYHKKYSWSDRETY